MKIPATPVILAIGFLWVVITVLGLLGSWFPALLLSVVLLTAHLILGASHRGRIDTRLLAHPILTWAALWIASFVLAEVFARADAGAEPLPTILGFHPSFACIVFGYWIGGVVVLTLGFSARRRLWMDDERWNEFTTTIAELNADRTEADHG